MEQYFNAIDTYLDWATNNTSKCSPRHYAIHSELARMACKKNSSSLSVNPSEMAELMGIKESRLIISTLEDLEKAGLLMYVYRSKNGKKNHEVFLFTFKKQVLDEENTHPSTHPDTQPSSYQALNQAPTNASHVGADARSLNTTSLSNVTFVTNETGDQKQEQTQPGEKPPIKIPALRHRVDEFETANPLLYPSLFYDDFCNWWSAPSDQMPHLQRWETKIGPDKHFNLKGLLEYSWATKGQPKYNLWTVGKGFPSQATGTDGIDSSPPPTALKSNQPTNYQPGSYEFKFN